MSHRTVEIVLGRLVTDEAFRRRFRESPGAAFAEIQHAGLELSAVEIDAMAAVDADALARFARTLDPRLKKAELPVE